MNDDDLYNATQLLDEVNLLLAELDFNDAARELHERITDFLSDYYSH